MTIFIFFLDGKISKSKVYNEITPTPYNTYRDRVNFDNNQLEIMLLGHLDDIPMYELCSLAKSHVKN